MNDQTHKSMKKEVLEITTLLQHIDDYLNQYRGIIREDDFLQSNYEDKFIRELHEMESEIITVRDLLKIKRQVQIL